MICLTSVKLLPMRLQGEADYLPVFPFFKLNMFGFYFRASVGYFLEDFVMNIITIV